jgi:hypothetical protein
VVVGGGGGVWGGSVGGGGRKGVLGFRASLLGVGGGVPLEVRLVVVEEGGRAPLVGSVGGSP